MSIRAFSVPEKKEKELKAARNPPVNRDENVRAKVRCILLLLTYMSLMFIYCFIKTARDYLRSWGSSIRAGVEIDYRDMFENS